MSTKTFTLNSVFPSITSITKTKSNLKEAPKRATGAVLINRSSKATAKSRTKSLLGINWKSGNWVGNLSAIGLVLIVVGLASYIVTINASVSKGFELKQNQNALKELQETQKRLVVEQSALGSINKVNEVAATTGMVPVTNEEFLSTNQLSKR